MRSVYNLPNFIKKLKTGSFDDEQIGLKGGLTIDSNLLNWYFKEIKNVVFEDLVRVTSVEINSGLAFYNCEFKKGIYFSKVKCKNFDSTLNRDNYSILLNNCKASIVQFDGNCVLDRAVKIENKSDINGLHIIETHIKNGGIQLSSSIINNLDISRVASELRLRDMTINKHLRFDNLLGDISLISSTFNGWVKILNVDCYISLTFNKNTFNDTLKVKESRIKGLFMHGDTFNKKVDFDNKDLPKNEKDVRCEEIYITEANFVEGAFFNGFSKKINKITLSINPNFKGVLTFSNWEVNELSFSGVNQNLKLLFKNLNLNSALLHDFTNYNDLSFVKCKSTNDGVLELKDCDLGKAKFNEFNFDSFNKIKIDNVTLDEIRASNVKWFSENSLEISSDNVDSIDNHRRIREVYRQIKHALIKSGNQIDSLIFKAREIEAYRNELKSGNYNWGDKVIMTISRTNNFGLNWRKPLGLIFLITVGFYILMLPLFSDKIDYTTDFNFELKQMFFELYDNIKVFWQLFNPTRKFSSVYGMHDSGWLYFLDIIHKLILGIFIFQIIKGFRRLNLK